MPKCLQHIILSQPIYRKYSKRKSLFSLKNIKQAFVCPCVIVSHEASASYGQQRFCLSSSHLPPMKLFMSLIHFFPFAISSLTPAIFPQKIIWWVLSKVSRNFSNKHFNHMPASYNGLETFCCNALKIRAFSQSKVWSLLHQTWLKRHSDLLEFSHFFPDPRPEFTTSSQTGWYHARSPLLSKPKKSK